jgi:acetyl-CoA synthetase
MKAEPDLWLNSYHFYENSYDDYEELYEEFEWQVPDQFNIANYVCDRWAKDKERIAVFSEDRENNQSTYTYQELKSLTNQLANYLREQGVERGDPVAINVSQRPEVIITQIATWKLGAVIVPMSTLFGPESIESRLSDCNPVAGIVEQENIEAFREARDEIGTMDLTLVVDGDDLEPGEAVFWRAIEDSSKSFDTVETSAEDDAMLFYTSGTTGKPKGVRHAHRAILGGLPMFVTTWANMDLREGDVMWTPTEWAWMGTLFTTVMPALYYGKSIVAYNRGDFDPEFAFKIIERYGITNIFAPPTAIRMMMQEGGSDDYDVETVRTIASGGEALGEDIRQWASKMFDGATVHEGYGQSEAINIAGDCTALTELREGKIGPPAPGRTVEIVDPQTAEPTVDRGDVGEIAVRYEGDPTCFKGYLNNPEKTNMKVKNGWLLTEDLGWLDDDGYLSFEGRKDEVIISAGYKIGPTAIEETLIDHPYVADAGVIGIPDNERGEVPKAFVVLTQEVDSTENLRDDLRQHVRDQLAKHEYPREIEFVEELPKTKTDKVRRADLREKEGIE